MPDAMPRLLWRVFQREHLRGCQTAFSCGKGVIRNDTLSVKEG